MQQSLGLCDPEPVPFVVYVPHSNHPIWTMPNCSEDASTCLSIYRRRLLDMGVSMTKNFRYTGRSTVTPQNWVNMTIMMMSLSLVMMILLIGSSYFSRVNRELKAHKKDDDVPPKVEEWYQNMAAKSYSLLMSMNIREREEMINKKK